MCSTLYQPLEVLLYVFHSASAEPQGPWQEVRALGPSQVFPMCVLRPGQCPMLHGHVAFCIPQNMMLFKACMDVSLISFPSQASLDCLFPKCYQFRKQWCRLISFDWLWQTSHGKRLFTWGHLEVRAKMAKPRKSSLPRKHQAVEIMAIPTTWDFKWLNLAIGLWLV